MVKKILMKCLQKNYTSSTPDESMWPQKRSFTLFGEWFSYSLHTMIFDTQKGFIEKIYEDMFNDINTDN